VSKTHEYDVRVRWTGNYGSGTSGYREYGREHEATAAGQDGGPPVLAGSSDPSFRGDRSRWNPEQLLAVSVSQCHMLWYLHLCSVSGVVVTDYRDDARATMAEDDDGGGRFTEVVLRPRVTVASADMTEKAVALHDAAHRKCFIANSVNFPVRHEPVVLAADAPDAAGSSSC
jgi:organic hydroperoxide reductase OsmC/OhrA